MSATLPEAGLFLTRDEYFQWCDRNPGGRFERIDGEVVAMTGQVAAHLRTKIRVLLELRRSIAVAGVGCEALPDGATVSAGESDFQPDATINCGPLMDDDERIVPNPVVVVEVLSPSTTKNNTTVKLAGYFLAPSIVHYLIVHPTNRMVVHHRRLADGIATAIVPAGPLALQPPGIMVLIDNFYTDAPFGG